MSHVSDSDYQSVCFESQILDRQQVFLPLKMWSYCMLILQGGAKSSVNYERPFVTYFVQPQCTPKTTIYGQRSSFVSSCSNKQIQIKRCVFRPRWYISPWDLSQSADHWNVAISQYLIAAMTCQLDNREKCFKYGIQPLSDLRVSRDKMTFRFFVCVR